MRLWQCPNHPYVVMASPNIRSRCWGRRESPFFGDKDYNSLVQLRSCSGVWDCVGRFVKSVSRILDCGYQLNIEVLPVRDEHRGGLITFMEVEKKEIKARAMEEYNKGNYKEAVTLFASLIDKGVSAPIEYFNRATCYHSLNQHQQVITDCLKAIELGVVNEACYTLLSKTYIHNGRLQEATSLLQSATSHFPNSQKLKSLLCDVSEKSLVSNEDQYLDSIFTKLCEHSKVSGYLKDQQFVTKLEMLVRNPSLLDSLGKLDARIYEAYDLMLMADESAPE